MSLKPIEGSNTFFELARELKYANKQIDKLRRELAQLRNDFDKGFRVPEGWPQSGAFAAPRRETHPLQARVGPCVDSAANPSQPARCSS